MRELNRRIPEKGGGRAYLSIRQVPRDRSEIFRARHALLIQTEGGSSTLRQSPCRLLLNLILLTVLPDQVEPQEQRKGDGAAHGRDDSDPRRSIMLSGFLREDGVCARS